MLLKIYLLLFLFILAEVWQESCLARIGPGRDAKLKCELAYFS